VTVDDELAAVVGVEVVELDDPDDVDPEVDPDEVVPDVVVFVVLLADALCVCSVVDAAYPMPPVATTPNAARPTVAPRILRSPASRTRTTVPRRPDSLASGFMGDPPGLHQWSRVVRLRSAPRLTLV
jgi:hypothetical protein